jgi:glycosyltransferase involved in cell wall biosynthesis
LLLAFKDVISELPQSELWFVGNVVNEEYYKNLLELIEVYNLKNSVKVYDFMDQSKLSKIYNESDCFVLPSLQEGAPNVLLESMYMQLPIISTYVGNAESLLLDFGMLVPNCYDDLSKLTYADLETIALNFSPRNKENLVLGMLSVFSNYQYWVDKAKESSSFLKDEYIMDKVVEKYENLFLENLV